MSKTQRYRSRFTHRDLGQFWRENYLGDPALGQLNRLAHAQSHPPKRYIWNSTDTIADGDLSREWSPPHPGRIIGIKVEADTGNGPSSGDFIGDVLLNGNSIFYNANKPRIQDGTDKGFRKYPDVQGWKDGDYLTIQHETVEDTVGPITWSIDYIEEDN